MQIRSSVWLQFVGRPGRGPGGGSGRTSGEEALAPRSGRWLSWALNRWRRGRGGAACQLHGAARTSWPHPQLRRRRQALRPITGANRNFNAQLPGLEVGDHVEHPRARQVRPAIGRGRLARRRELRRRIEQGASEVVEADVGSRQAREIAADRIAGCVIAPRSPRRGHRERVAPLALTVGRSSSGGCARSRPAPAYDSSWRPPSTKHCPVLASDPRPPRRRPRSLPVPRGAANRAQRTARRSDRYHAGSSVTIATSGEEPMPHDSLARSVSPKHDGAPCA